MNEKIIESWEQEFDKEFDYLEGNVPLLIAYIRDLLSSARADERKRIVEEVEGMKIKHFPPTEELVGWCGGYNEALDVIIKALAQEKEVTKTGTNHKDFEGGEWIKTSQDFEPL